MNRLTQTICVLGVAAAGLTPVLLYANQDGRAPAALSGGLSASNPEAVTVAVWTPPGRSEPSFADLLASDLAAPIDAVYADALPATYEGDYDDPLWAVVTRGARLHADPDVASPTTWFYGVGAKLHVVGYRQGWYQVVDPETSRRGFIFARHYLEALRGPDATPVMAKVETLPQTALAEPAPAETPVLRHASSRTAPYLLAPSETPAPVVRAATRTASRPGGVAGLLDKAIRR